MAWPRDMTAAAVVCGACGTELPPNSKFCNECGAAVATAATPAEYKQVTVLFAELVIRSGYTCDSRKLPARDLILRLDLTTRGAMMAAFEASVRTTSGGSLAYAQMGQQDGTPVFAFHGVPGSRLDWDHPLIRPVLDGSGVRLIGIDRPGFGGSTHQPHRRYADWPADVLAGP